MFRMIHIIICIISSVIDMLKVAFEFNGKSMHRKTIVSSDDMSTSIFEDIVLPAYHNLILIFLLIRRTYTEYVNTYLCYYLF